MGWSARPPIQATNLLRRQTRKSGHGRAVKVSGARQSTGEDGMRSSTWGVPMAAGSPANSVCGNRPIL